MIVKFLKVPYHQRVIEREIDFKVNFDEKAINVGCVESPRLRYSDAENLNNMFQVIGV